MKTYIMKAMMFVLSAGLVSTAAHAGIIYDSVYFSVDNTGASDTTTGSGLYDRSYVEEYLTLDRFDSSLGTLTDVNISFSSTWRHLVKASAVDAFGFKKNDAIVRATGTTRFGLSLIDPSSESTADFNRERVYCSDTGEGVVGCSDRENEYGTFNDSLSLSSFDLSNFIGTDDLDFRLSSFTTVSGGCDNNDFGDICSAKSHSWWEGHVTVEYVYDAVDVPEPSTTLMLGLGLLGLVRLRHKMQ